MKKIDFKHVSTIVSFEGDTVVVDVTRDLGNLMMYNGSLILDIGFEDLARAIYYSEGEVDVDERYIQYILQLINSSTWKACVKRALIALLKG